MLVFFLKKNGDILSTGRPDLPERQPGRELTSETGFHCSRREVLGGEATRRGNLRELVHTGEALVHGLPPAVVQLAAPAVHAVLLPPAPPASLQLSTDAESGRHSQVGNSAPQPSVCSAL